MPEWLSFLPPLVNVTPWVVQNFNSNWLWKQSQGWTKLGQLQSSSIINKTSGKQDLLTKHTPQQMQMFEILVYKRIPTVMLWVKPLSGIFIASEKIWWGAYKKTYSSLFCTSSRSQESFHLIHCYGPNHFSRRRFRVWFVKITEHKLMVQLKMDFKGRTVLLL